MNTTNVITKTQIVDIVAEGTGLTKTETAAVIDGFLATIGWALSADKGVTLRKFGSFHAARRKSRVSRNPRTGELLTVPAHRAVVFRPSKELRHNINEGSQQQEAVVDQPS